MVYINVIFVSKQECYLKKMTSIFSQKLITKWRLCHERKIAITQVYQLGVIYVIFFHAILNHFKNEIAILLTFTKMGRFVKSQKDINRYFQRNTYISTTTYIKKFKHCKNVWCYNTIWKRIWLPIKKNALSTKKRK